MQLLTPWLERRRYAIVKPWVRGSILDVGCGPGLFAEGCEDYTGVDVNADSIRMLSRKYPSRQFLLMDIEHAHFDFDRKFETVVMTAVLEHLSNPRYVLQQIRGLIGLRGRLVITTPTPLGGRCHSLGGRIGLFSQEAVHDHKFIYNRSQLTDVLGGCGFSIMHYETFEFGGNQLVVARA